MTEFIAYGKEDSVKETHQGFLSREILRTK